MASSRDAGAAAVRRFSAVWALSIAVKLAAVVVLVYFVVKFLGGA